jgi:hypothetical protein
MNLKLKNIKLNRNNKRLFLIFILLIITFIYYYFEFDKIKTYVVELFTGKNKVELFENKNNIHPWSEDLRKRFLEYQNTMSRNDYNYNLEILQQQVTPEEVEEYLKTGYWNWDETLKKLYLDKVQSSTLVNLVPEESLNYAMKMYTPKAVKQLLAWNYKEGEFLLYGAKDVNKNIIKCSSDVEPSLTDDKNNKINNEDIPNIIPGFSFINEPCNPCKNLNLSTNNKCAFKLNIEGDDTTSEIWKRIWKL